MSVDFLHGIETIESSNILASISEVRSAVIGVIGTAPEGPINEPVLITTAAEAAQFGDVVSHGITSGFTLPYTLAAIQEYGAGTIIAINVYAPHVETVEQEDVVFDEGGCANLAHSNVFDVSVISNNGETEYSFDADFFVNFREGKVFRNSEGALANVGAAKVTYKYSSNQRPEIGPNDIIGSTDAEGHRTGAQVLLESFNTFGFTPKILIAPGFSEVPSVQTALIGLAEKLRSVVLIDAPLGLSVSQAIQSRNAPGNLALSSDRAYILYPHLYHYDPETDQDQLMPYSVTMAGLMAKTDRDYGYWCSPSNKNLVGITALERNVSSSYTDDTCDVNRLNERAITSVMNAYGSGYKAYGNRLASFNSVNNTGLDTFLTTRRVSDMIAEALEQAMAQFIDTPLSTPIINDITTMGQNFINTLTRRGAIIGGSCYPSATENTAENLSQGRLVMVYEYNPPAPLERITHQLILTNSYYES